MKASFTLAVAALICCSVLPAQPPVSPDNPRALERRLDDLRHLLERNVPVDAEQRELAMFARRYLDEAATAANAGRLPQAQRLLEAADACRRPIDHLQHLRRSGPKATPNKKEPDDHLRQVYFRLKLGDAFLQQIPPPPPRRLLDLARKFYEKAVKAQQEESLGVASEYIRAADDLTHALESLAQAAVP